MTSSIQRKPKQQQGNDIRNKDTWIWAAKEQVKWKKREDEFAAATSTADRRPSDKLKPTGPD